MNKSIVKRLRGVSDRLRLEMETSYERMLDVSDERDKTIIELHIMGDEPSKIDAKMKLPAGTAHDVIVGRFGEI